MQFQCRKDCVQCIISDKFVCSGRWEDEGPALKENQKLLRWIRESNQQSSSNDGPETRADPPPEPSLENHEEEMTDMQRARQNMLEMHE